MYWPDFDTSWYAYVAGWNSYADWLYLAIDNLNAASAEGFTELGFALQGEAIYDLYWCFIHTMGTWVSPYTHSAISNCIWYAAKETVPLTMADMLNAMLLATYEELQMFVGLADAYRSAVWSQPFNAEFYAALAQGFKP